MKKYLSYLLIITLMFGLLPNVFSSVAYASEADNNVWKLKDTLFEGRAGAGVAEVNGKFYVIGGASGSTVSNVVQEYDPETNKWSNKANMPTARTDLGVAVVDNKIYAIGGYRGNAFTYRGATNIVEVYDPTTNSWSTTTSMPVALSGGGTVACNNKIYVVGGLTGQLQAISTVQEYDPTTHTWSMKKNMPYALHHVGVTVLNDKIYAVGGGQNSARYNYLQEFDPNTNTWTNKAGMKVARNTLSASVLNGKIYAIGGSVTGEIVKTVETYDPTTNTWSQIADLNKARWGSISVTMDNQIYVIGGGAFQGKTTPVNSIEVYSALPNVPTNLSGRSGDRKNILTWTSVNNATSYNVKRSTNKGGPYTTIATDVTDTSYTDLYVENGKTYFYTVSAKNRAGESENSNEISLTLFEGRVGAGVAKVNGKFYVIGGASGSTVSNVVQEYDPNTNKWSNKANMPTARTDLGVAVVDNKIYAIGGYRGNAFAYGGATNIVEVYDPTTDSWLTTMSMPVALSGGGTVALNNKIYVVGGLTGQLQAISTVQEYDPATHTWSMKKNMPYALHHVGVTVLNDKIYAVGGGQNSARYNYLQEYDPNTNTWTNKAGMKVARNTLSASVLNGKIYAIGGSATGEIVKTVETYDPTTNTWSQIADLNKARWGSISVTMDNQIYIIGGGAFQAKTTPVNSIEVYSETASPTWKFVGNEENTK
ncbi:Kelch repeat-containing protein [Bacillus fungorum]|uniref:Kelch repeat-containing protein n=1 Tax=Bacillus fungorum TaxID=2039284 RepID=UPI003F55CFEA